MRSAKLNKGCACRSHFMAEIGRIRRRGQEAQRRVRSSVIVVAYLELCPSSPDIPQTGGLTNPNGGSGSNFSLI